MKLVEVKKGEEVLETVAKYCAESDIRNAAIVSIIGAVESCCISNMPPNDELQDTLNEYHIPLEMSGNGDVIDGKPHIHCVVSTENERTMAGHLHWAKVNAWYVKVYLLPY